MKATEHFRQTIKAYLDERAQNDELFAVSYAKENKNMDDCVTFILNQVKKKQMHGTYRRGGVFSCRTFL